MKNKLKYMLPLAFVSVLGVIIRVSFSSGLFFPKAFNISRAMWDISLTFPLKLSEWFSLDSWRAVGIAINTVRGEYGIIATYFYFPISIVYRFLGDVSELSTVLYGVFFSGLSIILVYFLVSNIADNKAGLLTALLWAVFPLDIYFSTSMYLTPFIFFVLLLFSYLFLMWLEQRRLFQFLISILFLAVLFFVRLDFGLMAVVWAALIVFRERQVLYRISARIAVSSYVFMLFVFVDVRETMMGKIDFLMESREFLFIFPLVLIWMVSALIRNSEQVRFQDKVPMLWLGLAFAFMPVNLAVGKAQITAVDFIDGVHILFFILPLFIFAGIGLSEHISENNLLRGIGVVLPLFMSVVVLWIAPLSNETCTLMSGDAIHITDQKLLLAEIGPAGRMALSSDIIGGVYFISLLILFIIQVNAEEKWGAIASGMIILLFSLTMLSPIIQRYCIDSGFPDRVSDAIVYLEAQAEVLPVYVADVTMLRYFDFQYSYSWQDKDATDVHQFRIRGIGTLSNALEVEDGYVVMYGHYLSYWGEAPAHWKIMTEIENRPNQKLIVFKIP